MKIKTVNKKKQIHAHQARINQPRIFIRSMDYSKLKRPLMSRWAESVITSSNKGPSETNVQPTSIILDNIFNEVLEFFGYKKEPVTVKERNK